MEKVLIIEARFYENIADQLVEAAVEVLEKEGVPYERVAVPGCFEIPAAVAFALKSKQYAGYLALGCVIRGETTHYDYVCEESARGLNDLAIRKKIAVGYGIITAENREQAYVRADKARKNVGGRAARACIEMMALRKRWVEKKKHD